MEPINFKDLLTPQQLQLAGWGIGIVVEAQQVPIRPPSTQESSIGQDPPSGHEIPPNANDPSGFGSLFSIPNEVLNANIGPLHDFLNDPSDNY